MREFGWTIEYVLGLSYPVFFDLFGLIRRVRLDSAIDEFYLPYAAAKYGGKCQKNLFEGRGGFYLSGAERKPQSESKGYTKRELKLANERLARIIQQREEQLAIAASAVDA